ncbi:MAG: FecR domain-containing protein [Deltaproteobacteria bacterium]|nr:FecR domain-containing protein [Deltaproteobacteria bacterium]
MISENRQQQLSEILRSDPVPWDDLRERRVLGEIQQQLIQCNVRPTSRFDTRLLPFPALAAVAAFLLLGLGALLGAYFFSAKPSHPVPANQTTHSTSQNATPDTSVVEIEDIGEATLSKGAKIAFEKKFKNEIRFRQSAGRIHYSIVPQHNRTLVVHVQQIEVRVVGTAFDIEITRDSVSVDVVHGTVLVTAENKRLRLNAGERFDSKSFSKNMHTPNSDNHRMEKMLSQQVVDDAATAPSKGGPKKPASVSHEFNQDASKNIKNAYPQTTTADISPPTTPDESDVTRILKEVDKARRIGNLNDAGALLRQLIRTHPRHADIPIWYFTLGNVTFASGQYRAATQAYHTYLQKAPGGVLAEDAIAAIADAFSHQGDGNAASKAAKDYLEKYPVGVHAARMKAISK